MGNATMQGKLWGRHARNWTELQEPAFRPIYATVIAGTGAGPNKMVLDAGCGAGLFCQMTANAGAVVYGIDAAEPLVAIAKSRLPEADFRVGDLEELPFDDGTFDIVTGFNSFQFCADGRWSCSRRSRTSG